MALKECSQSITIEFCRSADSDLSESVKNPNELGFSFSTQDDTKHIVNSSPISRLLRLAYDFAD